MQGEGTLKYFTSDTTNVKNLVFETNHCNFHLSHDNSHLGLASVIRFNVTGGFTVYPKHAIARNL